MKQNYFKFSLDLVCLMARNDQQKQRSSRQKFHFPILLGWALQRTHLSTLAGQKKRFYSRAVENIQYQNIYGKCTKKVTNQTTEKDNCIDGYDCQQIQNALLTVERQMIKELLLFLIQPNNYV